jgi:WD40 repeat protein
LDIVEQKIEEGDMLQFSPDGKTLLSAYDKTVSLCDIKTGKITQTIKLKTHATTRDAFAISPDGKRIAIAERNENLRIVDIATGKDLAECRWSSSPCNVTWSQDSKHIASTRDGRVRIWDVDTLLKTRP